MSVTPQLVRELREKTGAGMMDCKKALVESSGDMDQAVDWLRSKGLAAAAKKAGRCAAEGLVGVSVNRASQEGSAPSSAPYGVAIEINTETDFVARNPEFQKFLSSCMALALKNRATDVSAFRSLTLPEKGQTVDEALTGMVASIGEHMSVRRLAAVQVSSGVVSSYVHGSVEPGMGRIGVLVALESPAGTEEHREKLEAFGRQVAMHIAASTPLFLSVKDVDAKTIEQERAILAEQARDSGRPENVIEKMIEGRLRKYYAEVVLEEQPFVVNPDRTIAQAVADISKDLGVPVTLKEFVRLNLGEGIEKESTDFAKEVQAQLQA